MKKEEGKEIENGDRLGNLLSLFFICKCHAKIRLNVTSPEGEFHVD